MVWQLRYKTFYKIDQNAVENQQGFVAGISESFEDSKLAGSDHCRLEKSSFLESEHVPAFIVLSILVLSQK